MSATGFNKYEIKYSVNLLRKKKNTYRSVKTFIIFFISSSKLCNAYIYYMKLNTMSVSCVKKRALFDL